MGMVSRQAFIDDAALVERILDGQTHLFRLVAERYAERMMRMISRLVPSREDAEEVTQDALVEAFRSLSRFDRQQASLHTWLMRIAYHMALKHYRKVSSKTSPEGNGLRFVDANQEWLENISDDEADALLSDTSPDRISLLEKAIGLLKPDDQMLLTFYYFDDYSIKEIQDITGHDGGYLRSRLQWIRKKLAREIES
mgnify:CR=1 FL=1